MILISDDLIIPTDEVGLPLIGWHNLVTISNISTTTEDNDFPATNLANPATHLKWRAGVNSSTEYITITLGSDSINYVAVARHNFGVAQTIVTLEEFTGGSPPWQEIAFSTMPAIIDNSPLILRFAARTATAIRLVLNSSIYVPEAAVLYAGMVLQMERSIDINPDHVPLPLGVRTSLVTGMSESGNFLGRIMLSQFRESTAEFAHVTPSWYRSTFDEFVIASKDTPFFWVWNPDEYPNETGFGWLIEDIMPETDPITRRVAFQMRMRGVADISSTSGLQFNASAEADQFFERVSGLTVSQQSTYATLIDALVAGGVWSKIDALYIFAAPTQSIALTNLKSSSFEAEEAGTIIFESNAGYRTDTGISPQTGYIDTNFNPTTAAGNFTQNSAHQMVYMLDHLPTLSNYAAAGAETAATLSHIFPRYTDDKTYLRINDAIGAPSAGINDPISFEFFLVNRSGASAGQAYRDSTTLTYTAATSAVINNNNFYICATNANGVVQSHSRQLHGAASFGGSLTSGERTTFYNALKAFMDVVRPPLYLFAHYSSVANSLFIANSRDSIALLDFGVSYNPTPDPGVRDPSILFVNDVLYCAYTNVVGLSDVTSSFSYAKSLDGGHTWTRVGTISCSNLSTGSGRIWAPDFYQDTNGDIWVFFSFSTSSGGTFQPGAVKASDIATNSWGTAVAVTGSALPSNVIDGHIVRKSGIYYMFYKNETSKFIEVVSSSSLTNGYNTLFGSGDWAGWGVDHEGAQMLSLGGTSWRIYIDAYNASGMQYSDSNDDWVTWSTPVYIESSAFGSNNIRHCSVVLL
jgi:hypothetical protein